MQQAIARFVRGISATFRLRLGALLRVALCLFALLLVMPPLVLSVARKPVDYFTFNPWLPELPRYLFTSNVPWQQKLEFLPNFALFWFSADSPMGGVEWGFAVTLSDLCRTLILSLLFGLYFALVFRVRDVGLKPTAAGFSAASGTQGIFGTLAGVFGISTGGCTVMGCGAPVIPVIGLAFVGLSSGTLVLLAALSRVATILVFAALTLGVVYFAWLTGGSDMSRRP